MLKRMIGVAVLASVVIAGATAAGAASNPEVHTAIFGSYGGATIAHTSGGHWFGDAKVAGVPLGMYKVVLTQDDVRHGTVRRSKSETLCELYVTTPGEYASCSGLTASNLLGANLKRRPMHVSVVPDNVPGGGTVLEGDFIW